MKTRPANLFWMAVLLLVVAGFIYAAIPSRPDNRGKKFVEETRRLLRQQGFKTGLADFDFSTSPELRAREVILKATVPTNRFSEPFRDHPNLMEIVGTNSAIVVWKENELKRQNPDNGEELSWNEFREAITTNAQLDAARAAILSGPIAFNLNASAGNAMLLPHLAVLKNLTQTLGSRMILNLHDGDKDAAFTNLLAETRLVAAWNPEPAEISHLVRFGDTKLVLNATWQALQADTWPDEQLARLQAEWEAVNFFTNLPETAAFKRASDVAACEHDRHEFLESRPPFDEFFHEALRAPYEVWFVLLYRWSQGDYLRRGVFEDETNLLVFYRDREIELRNAVQAPTWMQMRQLPGVANEVFFQSKNLHAHFQVILNLHRMNTAFQRQGSSLLGRAAEAETERRILITAIALERYRGKHGSYPQKLAELAPEFLKMVPADFMDGQPLRYRPTDDGHFILYSVGQDCVDDGGKMQRSWRESGLDRPPRPGTPLTQFDLVWPLPAGGVAMQEEQQIQAEEKKMEARAEQSRYYREQQQESVEEWKQSPLRQSRVAQIFATNWLPVLDSGFFDGHPAAEFLRNANVVSNQMSLAELMTPRHVLTGHESEDLTFEFPVSYDAITNHGFFLLLDADTDPQSMFAPDSGAKVQERSRAANGNCLLVWHTIFDPPGEHALQVELTWYNTSGAETWCRGPAISVTTSNLCQFSFDSSTYDVDLGARFHARLPEKNGLYSIECVTTNGEHLKTLNGSTSNGEFNVVWNLVDDHGHRLTGETFNSIVHITLPDSGRTQTLKGP